MRRAACIAIVLGALCEIGAEAWIHARAPKAADWDAAAAFVRKRHAPGDGVVFAPAWTSPIGRLHFGDLVPIAEAANPDRARQARIFEVTTRGARHADATGRVIEERGFGGVRVRLHERAAARVLYDFTQAGAAEAHVADIDFAPVRCLPLSPGHMLRFPDVPLGGAIVISGGIDDFQSRYASSAPVTLDVLAGDARLAALRFDSDGGWQRHAIDTARLAGTRAELRFQLQPTKARDRTFCFHAEARR